MEPRELRQETLVEHPELGVGKITRVEREQHRAVINFRSEPEYRMTVKDALASLEARPAGGLSAHLYENPDDVLSWVVDGQLRLVGATLLDLGGAGKTKDLQSRLEKPVLSLVGAKWATWWNKVQPSLKESEYFEFQKPYTYRLQDGVYVEQIPVEPLTATAKVKKTAPTRNVSQDLQLLREAHAAELKQQREQHNVDLIQQREAHAAELKQQRENHTAELRQQMDSHSAELKLQRENQDADLKQQQDSRAADLKQQREAHAADLEWWRREGERLQNRIDTLGADKAAQREMSKIEITQDMLLRVGDAIQRIYQLEETPEECHTQLKHILPVALRDGGAELLGTVGDVVPYEDRLHHTPETVDAGTPVRISAPGVIVTGGPFEDKVILKANAVPVSEVS